MAQTISERSSVFILGLAWALLHIIRNIKHLRMSDDSEIITWAFNLGMFEYNYSEGSKIPFWKGTYVLGSIHLNLFMPR